MRFVANGFSSRLPSGFEDRSSLVLVGPNAQDGFAVNLVVTRQPVSVDTSPEAFARSQLRQLPPDMQQLEVLSEGTRERRGRPVFERHHRVHVNDRTLEQLQAFMVLEPGLALIVTASAPQGSLDLVRPAFEEFVDGLEPSDPESLRETP
jgi:hypothetical protein